MSSRKVWKYLGIGFVGGAIGSAGLVVAVVSSLAFLSPSQSSSSSRVVLSGLECPSAMIEDMTAGKCVMSDKAKSAVSIQLDKIKKAGDLNDLPSAKYVRSLAEKTTDKPTLKFKLYRLAAFMGDAKSQYKVGAMLSNGTGCEEDDLESLRWLHESALNNYLDAQLRLSHMLSSGTFVKQDEKLAKEWLEKAEANSKGQVETAELGV